MTRIKVHKPILRARSSFFREAFAANETEVRLVERTSIVKIALEYLYSGWTDADIFPIALELMAFATKLDLTSLGNKCFRQLRDSLSASNAVDVIILAHSKMSYYDHIYLHCMAVIKGNAHRLSANDFDKLQQEPVLLRKLLIDCCMKLW